MPKVILTEKPSVARDIAKCLKVFNKKDGYIEGNGYQITWAFGHLVELKEPDEYNETWKRWSKETLPIIPEKFGLKPKDDKGAKDQLKIIKDLFKDAESIICATDAGREGELIFRYILSYCQCLKKPIQRLWISSMTDEAILKGMQNLKDGHLYNNLYDAAKCRSESDWIVGLNATRFYTLTYGQNRVLWSLGRVQTPVLNMIVQRDLEIDYFKPEDFFEVYTKYRNAKFKHQKGRHSKEEDANRILEKIKGQILEITKVEGKEEKVNPPLLFDLTDLQKEMNKMHGMTADQVLQTAQALYEKKHLTYPRTDSRYLTKDMMPDTKPLLEKLSSYVPELIKPLDLEHLNTSKRIYDDAKVNDHHAIIPTNVLASHLSGDEAKLYNEVVKRFISVFYPPCIKEITNVFAETAKEPFKATGTVIKDQGWQIIYKDAPSEEEKSDDKNAILPNFEKGESGAHEPFVKKGQTTPPKPHNEASLLAMMETAGKSIEDEELKEALKEKGLGTPATRASIIETLLTRKYIARNKKNLLSTDSGRHLIQIISDEKIKSASMTGEWEAKLKEIEKGNYDSKIFMQEIKDFTNDVVNQKNLSLIDQSKIGACPLCSKSIIEGKTAFGCSGWKEGCSFLLKKELFGITITIEMAREILQRRTTLQFYEVNTNGEQQSGFIVLDKTNTPQISIVEAQKRKFAEKAVLGICPLCQKSVLDFHKSFSCTAWREGCQTTIWKEIAGKKITEAMAKKLLTKGETGILKGFVSKKTGKTFDANLTLVNGRVEMKFDSPPSP